MKCAFSIAMLSTLLWTGCGNPVGDATRGDQVQRFEPKGGPIDWLTAQWHRLKDAMGFKEPGPELKGDLNGYLLTWFDQDGAHLARKRSEIPEPSRSFVRVQKPHETHAKQILIAHLSKPLKDGTYPTEILSTEAYNQKLQALVYGSETQESSDQKSIDAEATIEAIIYGASWCEPCHIAARYFREHSIPFVEKDIERAPKAKAEMLRKCREAGVQVDGIPVIDFRGHILLGFDEEEIERVIASGSVVL